MVVTSPRQEHIQTGRELSHSFSHSQATARVRHPLDQLLSSQGRQCAIHIQHYFCTDTCVVRDCVVYVQNSLNILGTHKEQTSQQQHQQCCVVYETSTG